MKTLVQETNVGPPPQPPLGKCARCGKAETRKDPRSGEVVCRFCNEKRFYSLVESERRLLEVKKTVLEKQLERLEKQLVAVKEFQTEFKKQLVTLMIAAFGFVAAFFWNTAIKDLITAFVPQMQTWVGELVTAIIVTFIAVLVIYFLSKSVEKP